MAQRPRECPCFSGLRYTECCKPLHDGVRSAELPEALMRSRYSAFALGLGAYLVATLAREHPDRELPAAQLARELGRAKDKQRFTGLHVFSSSSDGARGEVTFYARVFERGVDHSFIERSRFVHEEGHWRYLDGVLVPHGVLPDAPTSLSPEALDALIAQVDEALR